jgi:hypothetical protein
MARKKVNQHSQIEDNPTTTQCDTGMGASFIGLVYNVISIGYLKIKKFCQE